MTKEAINRIHLNNLAKSGSFYYGDSGERYIGLHNGRLKLLDNAETVRFNPTTELPYNNTQSAIEALNNDSGVTSGVYGDNTHIPQITVDSKGKITNVVDLAITGGSGNVIGPVISVNDDIVLFDGITGDLIKDSGVTLSSLVPNSRQITINGTTYDLSADRTWTISVGTGYVPYTGATANVNIGTHSLIANNGTYNSEMSPSLFGVENAAGTIFGVLEYNKLTLTNSTGAGSIMEVNAQGLIFPDASVQISSYTDAKARLALSLTTTGTSGVATYNNTTGVFNIPNYGSALSGYVPYTGATSDVDLGEKELTTGKLWLYDAAGGPTEKGSLHYADEALHFENSDAETLLYVEPGFMQLHKTGTIQSNFFTTLLTVNRDHYLPDASGTIALTSNIGTWGALNYPTWVSGTPFVKMTAAGTFALDGNTYLTSVGTGTANELTYWSGANTIGSLTTATYPSLTELSYVKGVTSAIQTQINAKFTTPSGTTSQYVRGDGSLDTFPSIPSITGLVPYTGANSNVVLGTYTLTTPSIIGVTGNLAFSNSIQSSGSSIGFNFTNSANTAQTASTNIPNFKITGVNKQWATGAIASQYFNYLSANTASFVGASTITNAYGLYVEPPTAGTNATITNNYAAGFNGNVQINGNINGVTLNTYTSTIGGYTVAPTQSFSYTQIGKILNLSFSITGTSTATTFTYTLPSGVLASRTTYYLLRGTNNGATVQVCMRTTAGSGTVDLFTNIALGIWTSSGVKECSGSVMIETQ